MTIERQLANNIAECCHRLANPTEGIVHVLRSELTAGQLQILVQELQLAGTKAAKLKPIPQGRAKGAGA
jgi:hypothetical protein